MIQLDGDSLTLKQVAGAIFSGDKVKISDEARVKVNQSRAIIDAIVKQGRSVYGVTTGFGKFSDTVISAKDAEKLQLNLIRSHACAVGELLPPDTVRTMLLLRANALAKGYSGITADALQLLIDMLNAGITPVIPPKDRLGQAAIWRRSRIWLSCLWGRRGAGSGRAVIRFRSTAPGRTEADQAESQGRAGVNQRHPGDDGDWSHGLSGSRLSCRPCGQRCGANA